MVADNKRIGNFRLDGIAPAPRGVPQIEVTFDIDANGILHVTAKDLGTGKEQAITITASSGLSDAEIERMVNEAKAHEAEDKAAKEAVEVRNRADSMTYQAEKQLKELGDKVDPTLKSDLEADINKIKELLKGNDTAAIKSASEAFEQKLMKLGEEIYKQQQAAGAAGADPAAAAGAAGADNSKKDDGNVVDAEVVD
jgi:molecular chaperone DnaK